MRVGGVYADANGSLWRCLGRSMVPTAWVFVSMVNGLSVEVLEDFVQSSMRWVASVH